MSYDDFRKSAMSRVGLRVACLLRDPQLLLDRERIGTGWMGVEG